MERDEIDLIKDELFHQYCVYKRKYSAKGSKFAIFWNDRTQEAFKKAAILCDELGAEPIDYISAQFARIHADQMMPAFLHGKDAKAHYKEYMEKRSMGLDELYDLQLMYLRSQILQAKRTTEKALMDDDINFHPWFRICITKEPVQEIIDKYREAAAEEMTPKLLAFLKKKNLDYKRITNE